MSSTTPISTPKDDTFRSSPHVIIVPYPPPPQSPANSPQIGAGIIGAIFAQALKKAHIPFTIYERDPHVHARGQGWGITLHWALPTLYSLLPPALHPAVLACSLSAEDSGTLLCLNAVTGGVNYSVKTGKRVRVRREQLREALLEGLEVNWGKRAVWIREGVVGFDDGSCSVKAGLVVGVDGGGSFVRRWLVGEEAGVAGRLPVRGVAGSMPVSRKRQEAVSRVAGDMLSAMNPEGGDYLWWSGGSGLWHP